MRTATTAGARTAWSADPPPHAHPELVTQGRQLPGLEPFTFYAAKTVPASAHLHTRHAPGPDGLTPAQRAQRRRLARLARSRIGVSA
jgi:hypothetical protein